MEFATIQFAYFALFVFIIFAMLKQHRDIQKAFLLGVSYYFCAQWNLTFLSIILVSSFFNYGVGELLHRSLKDHQRLAALLLGVVGNCVILGFFKYYDFFVGSLQHLSDTLGLSAHLPLLEIAAPFGLSFYTFQGVAYVVDSYKRKSVQPKTVLDFLLFISFFPQLGAGPICRSHELLPQIMAPSPKKMVGLSYAVVLIATGLFKKMVLGNYLAISLTTDAFTSPDHFSSLELVLAVFAYTAQVYLDFSGYTDIARGLGLLFGFKLPENFNYPYSATNIGDFWRRWHMTFSSWLRDYIYFPLGGSKKGKLRCYLNLFITFFICGIWHGATWGFVIWGALHGVVMMVYKASLDIRRSLGIDLKKVPSKYWVALSWVSTLSFCAFARIFFKAKDLDDAWNFIETLTQLSFVGSGFNLGVLAVTVLTFAMNFYGKRIFTKLVLSHESLPQIWWPVAWLTTFFLIVTLSPYGDTATLYFGF